MPDAVLLGLTVMGALYYALSTLALARHFRKTRPELIAPVPVSILKPVSGVDKGAHKSFSSFLRQDYPDYEVLFGALDADDPAVDVVSEAASGRPNVRLHIGSEITGSNNKVRILHTLALHARGEILVITDADTRVTPDFLARVTAPFRDARVGAVTCLYRGIAARTTADALEGLHMTCLFAPGVAAAEAISGIDFGLGAAIAIRASVLEEIGGFAAIADHLADDFHLCHRAARAGHRVALSGYVVEIVLSGERLRGVLSRELRWSRTTRISRPHGHFGLIVTFGFAWALGFLVSSGFSPIGWTTLATVTVIRVLTAWYGARICLADPEFPRRALLLPLRDLLSFAIWLAGYLSNTVTWRGRKLRVMRDGRMVEV